MFIDAHTTWWCSYLQFQIVIGARRTIFKFIAYLYLIRHHDARRCLILFHIQLLASDIRHIVMHVYVWFCSICNNHIIYYITTSTVKQSQGGSSNHPSVPCPRRHPSLEALAPQTPQRASHGLPQMGQGWRERKTAHGWPSIHLNTSLLFRIEAFEILMFNDCSHVLK